MKKLKINLRKKHETTIYTNVLIEEHEMVKTINGLILNNMNGTTDLLLHSIEEVYTKIKIITSAKEITYVITFTDGEVLTLSKGVQITKEQRDKVTDLLFTEAKLLITTEDAEENDEEDYEHIEIIRETIVSMLKGVRIDDSISILM